MLFKRDDGCLNSGYLSVNNKGYWDLTEEQKQDIWIEILKTLGEQYSEENCYNLINWYIDTFGHYNYLYHCEQCGDSVGEFLVEI